MLCVKCGAENPNDSSSCSSCGAAISPEPAEGKDIQASTILSEHPTIKVTKVLIVAGALLLIIGAFLPWLKYVNYYGNYSYLGVELVAGPVICLVGVLFLAALVLSWSEAASKWSVVMALLSAVPLALLGQILYVYGHEHVFSFLAYGLWVSLAGAIVVTGGSLLEFFGQLQGVIASQ